MVCINDAYRIRMTQESPNHYNLISLYKAPWRPLKIKRFADFVENIIVFMKLVREDRF